MESYQCQIAQWLAASIKSKEQTHSQASRRYYN